MSSKAVSKLIASSFAFFLPICLLLLAGGLACGQAPAPPEAEVLSRIGLAGESSRTARRIAAAEKLVTGKKYPEAIDEFQRILHEARDDLVPLDSRHSIHARRLCHLRICALAPEGLRLYRSRVDRQAQKWLNDGLAKNDPDILQRLVDEAFASSVTDQALDRLGDLAFEQGRFDAAKRWWTMAAPPASQESGAGVRDYLVFPSPQIDVAKVRAKQLLADLCMREYQIWPAELNAFRKLHARATGRLAGHDGNYVETLEKLAGRLDSIGAPKREEAWPTFAGSAARTYVLPSAGGALARLPQLQGPRWSVPLVDAGLHIPRQSGRTEVADPISTPLKISRSLAFFPIIVAGRALVCDARFVRAYDLKTGRRSWQYDLLTDQKLAAPGLSLTADADPDFTLTATSECVYARLGVQSLSRQDRGEAGTPDSFLVCLNLFPTPGKSLKKWIAAPPTVPGSYAVFEGAPLVSEGRVYVAVSRFTGVDIQTAVACFDARTKSLRWQRDVCTTQEPKNREQSNPRHLLTLADSQIVYCSESGAIAALDAATGRHNWSIRYPSRGPRTEEGGPSPRGLSPCVYDGGRIYVAPADWDRILCLDADTGHVLWESLPVEVIHLLGVAHGRLIFTALAPRSFAPQHSIRALDATAGRAVRTWFQPADGNGELATFGRGLLAGDRVYWPTSAGLYVLNQEDSEPVLFDPTIRGNLAAANGCLIAAGTESLSAYLPEDLSLGQRSAHRPEPSSPKQP
jgi:outer membrane protein assembly factor BamB